jgi:hypothetical protein
MMALQKKAKTVLVALSQTTTTKESVSNESTITAVNEYFKIE